ncbi:MAG: nickel-dependent lactate racemase [Aureliella sp.]
MQAKNNTVEVLFGNGHLSIQLPENADVTVIRKRPMPLVESLADSVREALSDPVVPSGASKQTLAQMARGARSACIAICDITRPVPNHLFLRPLIESLVDGGISLDRITVLVATGLHRPNLGDELAELVGDPWVLENVGVVNHDALSDSDHVDLGRTKTRGTPVKLDRRFAEADIRIATGLVEPHFMAGYSGGRKVIAPGLAHADTIRTFHNHKFMSNSAATNCNLAGNPLHEEQLEIVQLIGGALAVNTVIDENRKLSMINFGEIVASHAEAVNYIKDFCRVSVPSAFDCVVTSAAGYPLDKTYYQTVKGIVGAVDILQRGGELFIASDCGEGVGSPEYSAAQRQLTRLGCEGFLKSIRDQPLAEIDAWQTQMQTKALSVGSVTLYSSLSAEDCKLTGVKCTSELEQFESAIAAAISRSETGSVAVIPEGPYVIPYCSSEP